MRLEKLENIQVRDNRQRREFPTAKQLELEESILNKGLFHPILVRLEGQNKILIAGERRLRTIQKIAGDKMIYFHDGVEIEPGYIPITYTSELDEIELQEAEFDENMKRLDLTWQERTAALNRFAELRRLRNPEINRLAIATEIAESTDRPALAVNKELARAEFVSKHLGNEKVAAARSLDEAYKIASRQVQEEFESHLRTRIGDVQSEHQLYIGDCEHQMGCFVNDVFDCIITDPPYGMGADTFGDAGPEHSYEDTIDQAVDIAKSIFREGARICKPECHLYMFCDFDVFTVLRCLAGKYGWTVWRTPLIWDKGGSHGHNPIPSQAIRRSYELILYAYRGNKPALSMISDVLRDIPPVTGGLHAAEKPAELYRRLLARSCKPGDRVLDPCCGVGPVFDAANILKVRATGIELDPEFAKIADGRRFKKTVKSEAEAL